MQKFHRGDKVHIAKNMPKYMSHFESDFDGIVIGSYADQFGGSDTKSYSILKCDDGNEISWYEENQLTFITHVGEKGINVVESGRAKAEKQQSDLKWIVKNWNDMKSRNSISGFSMTTLMKLVGINNPWGSHGEGYVYYINSMATFQLLNPVLSTGNIKSVQEFISGLTQRPPDADCVDTADDLGLKQ